MARKAHIIACFLALCVAALAPGAAFAASNYTIEEVSTNLTVETNATASVVSRQILDFNGKNTGYTWYLHKPERGESLKITSLRAAPVDDGGSLIGDWVTLQMVDVKKVSQGEWPGDIAAAELRREADPDSATLAGRNGTQPWYSYSIEDGMVRSWFPAENGSFVIEVNYTLTHAVYVYRDVAELYWRYVHASLPVDSSNITFQVTLPVPPGAMFQPGEDVMAWGHGPNDGRFVVNPDGTVIYQIDFLQPGYYGESHIIFPASWMNNMYSTGPHLYTEIRRPAALAEEGQWVDATTRGAIWDNKVRVLFFSLAALVLAAGVVYVAVCGLSPRSRRALARVACTLFVLGLTVKLFFHEALTEDGLIAAAAVVAIASLFLPKEEAGQPAAEGTGVIHEQE